MEFRLHPSVDAARARAAFAKEGQAQIMPWLSDESAQALRANVEASQDWREVVNSGDKVFELDRTQQAKLGPGDRERLNAVIDAGAQQGFQFRYESIRVSDDPMERSTRATVLDGFAEFMSSEAALGLLAEVTGLTDIDFADAQATGYRPGDFLTAHHDEVAGKNRRAAYILGLTQGWRTEWGGLLLFHDDAGDVVRGLLPRFNCLNLFAVPRTHSVSQVATYAGTTRLSVTGWLRSIG